MALGMTKLTKRPPGGLQTDLTRLVTEPSCQGISRKRRQVFTLSGDSFVPAKLRVWG